VSVFTRVRSAYRTSRAEAQTLAGDLPAVQHSRVDALNQPIQEVQGCIVHLYRHSWILDTTRVVFPVDDETPSTPAPRLRRCPDCQVEMRVPHQGKYITLYVCPECGATVTVPPKHPLERNP
jgi:hypothetical protein